MHTPAVDDGIARDDLTRFVWTRRAGEVIFSQGEFGSELYVIEEGSVELLTSGPDGAWHRRALLTAGETFGERALLDEQAREISARAVTDCRLLRIDYALLLELIREKPLIGVYLLRRQVRRVRWLPDHAPEPQPAAAPAPAPAAAAVASVSEPAAAEPAPPPPLRPRFVHEASGREFVVPDDATEAMIGRIDRATGLAPEVDFSDVDLQRSLSRRHARLTRNQRLFHVVAEPGAGNGTVVNDQRLVPGQPVALRDGDRVRFGMVDTVFHSS